MTNQHPITPTSELVGQWEAETAHTTKDETWHVAVQAARWGADQELEACCALMDDWGLDETDLRFARRPQPPSLKEQALEAIGRLCATVIHDDLKDDAATVRRALEALDD